MSFAALAVRTCLVQAIRGQTLAGDGVEDSPSDPIALATKMNSPVISVLSDHELLRPRGRSFMQGTDDPCIPHANTVDITLLVLLPVNSALAVPGHPDEPLDAQKAGTAFAFDLMWRQITRALAFDDEGGSGVWADLWRRAVNAVVAVESRSYVGTPNEDVHIPARRIVMRLDVLDEPAFGALCSDFWPDFVAAMKTCDDLAGVAPVIEAAILGGDLPEWRATAALLGLRPADMAQISLGPLGGGPTDPLVPLSSVAVDGADPAAPDGALVVVPEP